MCRFEKSIPQKEPEDNPYDRRSLFVEAGIDEINVFLIQSVLRQPQAFAEPLEVDYLPGPEKFDDVVDVRIVTQTEDVVVGDPCFLLCGKVFREVGDQIALHRHTGCAPGKAGGGSRVDTGGTVYEVRVKSSSLDLVFRQIPGQLVDDSANHLQMAQFLSTCIVAKIAHLKSVEKQRLFVLYASYSIYASDRLGQASIRLLAYV